MIGLDQAKKNRTDDLRSWSTGGLRRRLKLEADMRRALSGVGCGKGLHRNFLSSDIAIIGGILRGRMSGLGL